MDTTTEPREPVIASYLVEIHVRGDRTRSDDTPTNESLEEAISYGLMRVLPEGATATIKSSRTDR